MGALIKAEQATTATAEAESRQYLTFMLGGEVFAIDILNVKEIIEYGHLTEVPMMPDFVRGVINLRGAVVPVVDLSSRFGRHPTEVTRRTCIVIAEVNVGDGPQDMGIVVDAVNEVLDIAARDIEPPPNFGAKIRADFIGGMGKVDDHFVILLEVDRVLSVEEMAELSQLDRGHREPRLREADAAA